MSRYKSFDATGQAPNGILYAGDLNAIQDMKADQANFSQNIDTGSLRIGETGLQLLRYGVGEARISGAARVDGIFRGLSGLFAGQYTTTQRDAIASGSRPYGLIIFNTTTNRYEQNLGTDASPSWQGLGRGILNADVAASAGIAYSKLSLAASIQTGDFAAGAKAPDSDLLDGLDSTGFLKLLAAGDRKITYGNVPVTFPGASNHSNQVTVSHGLGVVPLWIGLTPRATGPNLPWLNATPTSTSFQFQCSNPLTQPAAPSSFTVYWTAIG